MPKQKGYLNKADIDLLIKVMKIHFVTREDFEQFKSDMYDKLDIIIKNTTTTSDELHVTQSVVNNHKIQIRRLEDTLNLPAIV